MSYIHLTTMLESLKLDGKISSWFFSNGSKKPSLNVYVNDSLTTLDSGKNGYSDLIWRLNEWQLGQT